MIIDKVDINTPNLKAVNYSCLNEYYTKKYFKCLYPDGKVSIVVREDCLIDNKQFKGYKIFLTSKEDFIKILERDFAEENTNWSVNYLKTKYPDASAKNISYVKVISGFCILFLGLLGLFVNLFGVLNNASYFIQNILKIILFKLSLGKNDEPKLANISDDLPVYSVLIPLYQEELKVRSILDAIEAINYPKDKLDVKLILEKDDVLTNKAISVCDVADYIQIIKVPPSFPRTKPKALNYATPYIKGEYVTIYDAEDVPDPDQLLKTIHSFRNLPEKYVCIQAKLNFYNKYDNLLTRLFSIEYSIWFGYMLRGLNILDFPIALGGTSNHFKVDKLKEVGYWDPYNVTEDADLGIRLYVKGYKVHLIDSTTMEEAPTNIPTWIAQRARWIKGYLQTLFVFIKMKKDYKKFGFLNIASVYILLGLSTYSFFCLPWLFIVSLLDINYNIYYLWMMNSIFFFPYMYAIIYFIIKGEKGSTYNFKLQDWITMICWPMYFVLHTIACYRAVWETIRSPFKWNKTPHGLEEDM